MHFLFSKQTVDNPVAIGFFVTFGDYIYIKPTFLSITPFSMKFPVNIRPGSWSFLFSLLIAKYEIFTKIDEKPAN